MAKGIGSYKLARSQSSIRHLESQGLDTGHVHTALGTVIVEQYQGDAEDAWVYLSMAYRGRIYRVGPVDRRGRASDRGLAIIAGRFAADVVRMAGQSGRKHG